MRGGRGERENPAVVSPSPRLAKCRSGLAQVTNSGSALLSASLAPNVANRYRSSPGVLLVVHVFASHPVVNFKSSRDISVIQSLDTRYSFYARPRSLLGGEGSFQLHLYPWHSPPLLIIAISNEQPSGRKVSRFNLCSRPLECALEEHVAVTSS
jgi:hypothetical protein